MPERYYEKKYSVEDVSLYFEQVGIPHMSGRILGVLLIADPLEQSIDDLCERLQASKSSVSTNARLLSEMGLDERVPLPIPRRVCFRFLTGGWVTFERMYWRMMAPLHQSTAEGLILLKDEDSRPARAAAGSARYIFASRRGFAGAAQAY
jgi:DNA-binding transcriptional regulator GbsR (MarR family)